MAGFQNPGTGYVAGAAGTLPNGAAHAALHSAIGRVAAGIGDATIIVLGDSIANGLFTTNIGLGVTTQLIRGLAGALGIPVSQGLAGVLAGAVAGPDNRYTLGTGWTWGSSFFPNLSWGSINPGGGLCGANGAAGTASFQPAAGTFDTFDVYYLGSSSTFNVNFNGGANTNTGGGTGIQKVTVSGAATSRPLCNFNTVVGALGCMIVGVDPRLSTTPTLRIGNPSITAATTTGWAGGPANGSSQQCITVYNPNLCIVNLGVNDVNGGIPIATSQANWATLAAVAQSCQGGSGGIIFASENPVQPGLPAGTGTGAAYWAALSAFCAAHGYGYIDIFGNLNGNAGFTPLTLWSPSYYGDGNSIHPALAGSFDYGRMLADGLLAL